MIEIVYRLDPTAKSTPVAPPDPAAAQERLEQGNDEFAEWTDPKGLASDEVVRRVLSVDAADMGMPRADGSAQIQRPFAAVLGCADARAPVEMIFGQRSNSLFVVRVAGNVLGDECLGSLDYAVSALGESLKLLVVLGHTRCGAVTAAVDSYLEPRKYLATASSHPLRAVVDKILVAVRAADKALITAWGPDAPQMPGYRAALVDTAVGLNAALTAATLKQEFRDRLGDDRQVVYGVYDLVTRRVGLPVGVPGVAEYLPGLVTPPSDLSGFDQLAVLFATAPGTRAHLGVV